MEMWVIDAESLANGWQLFSLIPLRELTQGIDGVRLRVAAFALGVCALSFLLAYALANSLTGRLKKIVGTMQKVIQTGTLNERLFIDADDEIGEVQLNFNQMVDQLKRLMATNRDMGNRARAFELQALQHQINPHFLYNTLDMIFWMGKAHGCEEVCQAVSALARFYKLCLSQGSEQIRIKDELRHVQLYVDLQNMRYEDRITLSLDVPQALQEASMLKLLLQPLVENAILHGIMKRPDQRGHVGVTAEEADGVLVFTITDNGAGISPEAMAACGGGTGGADGAGGACGYGLRNIHERIQIRYGPAYGLSFARLEEGTAVYVRVPVE
jgi:two-component system sensor histidine kinase YesM